MDGDRDGAAGGSGSLPGNHTAATRSETQMLTAARAVLRSIKLARPVLLSA